jgi:arylsulfatase A-like enzyme
MSALKLIPKGTRRASGPRFFAQLYCSDMRHKPTFNGSRRMFLQKAAATGAVVLGSSLFEDQASAAGANAQPDIVFFLGEGARWDESSLAGNPLLKTPHLDRIGREGVVFNNAFCINSLCLPARATILSGLYSHSSGAVDNQHSKVPDKFPIISDLIRNAGYEIAFIGKSHVEGSLMDRYWDYYFGFRGQADYQHPVIVEGVSGKFGEPRKYHQYVDDLLTDKAVQWLSAAHERPICLFLWFYAPHAPFDRPLRMVNDFNGVPIPKPDSFDEYLGGYAGKPKGVIAADNKIGEQFLERDAPRSLEELVKDHYCGIESNDEDIGRVLGVLEKRGTLDRTAIVWSSDHGFFLGEHRFYDKRLMYEPSIRIPLMVRYPRRIKAGATSDDMALNLDLAPTLLDLANVPVPKHFQGKSLLPLAAGAKIAWRQDWLYEYYEYPGFENVRPCRGVRTARYKYIHYFTEPQEFEFYDLQADPGEVHNLYGDPSSVERIAKLAARLEALRRETGDHYVYTPRAPAAEDDPPAR